jgi:putative transposase
METVRTIVCELDPTTEQRAEIDATLRAFADACNSIAAACRAIHSTNKVKVQHACYRQIRETSCGELGRRHILVSSCTAC